MIATATPRARRCPPSGRNRDVSEIDEAELLDVAREAAEVAAAELRTRFGDTARGVRAKTTPTDLVSDADVAAEAAIRDVLARRRPGDAIVGEEGGATAGTTSGGDLRWVVDPLDGTINFLFGIPAFSVSVACENAAGTIAGIVLDPIRDECFSATRSGEPRLGGEQIQRPERENLATAMVATGFSYDAALRARQAVVLERVLPRVRDIRRFGSAALDLCWCACGRFDAFYERGLHAWDMIAGALVASRAGLEVRVLPAVGEDPAGVVVAPPALIDELYGLVVGA
jgi:myo-inositol-1(or 4)-monophosphatase